MEWVVVAALGLIVVGVVGGIRTGISSDRHGERRRPLRRREALGAAEYAHSRAAGYEPERTQPRSYEEWLAARRARKQRQGERYSSAQEHED
jgi:hypothetical protein